MIRNDLLKEFLSANNINTAIELQGALKNIFVSTLQEMLEAELDEHLGYTLYRNFNEDRIILKNVCLKLNLIKQTFV